MLHDLGKIGRRYQDILRKPGPLDDAERSAIRAHPERGAEIVARVRALSRAAEVVLCHHERVDGAGYPRGLPAERLSLSSRIVTVCDAFDAMTSDRSYRRALSSDDALAELRACSGSQFDTRAVDSLEKLLVTGRIPLLFPEAEAPQPAGEERERRA